MSMEMTLSGERSLNAIAVETGTDKSDRYHGYTRLYEQHLAAWRYQPLALLEIGVESGASLRMWREYFPHAKIYGLDRDPSCQAQATEGIDVFIGDQSDPSCLAEVVGRTGPLDVVIDDGSHMGEHQIASFECLFPHMRAGGLYVVEDLHTSYWGLSARGAVAYFQALVDAVMIYGRSPCGEIRNDPNYPRLQAQLGYFERNIESIQFYRSILFVRKVRDSERAVPAASLSHQPAQRAREAAGATTPNVVIVVPVYNALHHVQRCLPTLVRTCPGLPLIVVDDGSDGEAQRWLRSFLFGEWPGETDHHRFLVRDERQQLFTRAANRGVRWAYRLRQAAEPVTVDYVAVVNTDCELEENWLTALLLGMDDPEVGIVGFADPPDGLEPGLRETHEPDFIAGHCLLLRMSMLEEIGVFCETDTNGADSPGLAGLLGQAHVGSDRGLSWRANRAGWKTLCSHCLLCRHPGGGSWHNDLQWLSRFDLRPLWSPCDQLRHPTWVETSGGRG